MIALCRIQKQNSSPCHHDLPSESSGIRIQTKSIEFDTLFNTPNMHFWLPITHSYSHIYIQCINIAPILSKSVGDLPANTHPFPYRPLSRIQLSTRTLVVSCPNLNRLRTCHSHSTRHYMESYIPDTYLKRLLYMWMEDGTHLFMTCLHALNVHNLGAHMWTCSMMWCLFFLCLCWTHFDDHAAFFIVCD